MLLKYWRELTPEEVLAMRNQLRTIWNADHGKMGAALAQGAQRVNGLPVLGWALSNDGAAMEEFDRLKAALPR